MAVEFDQYREYDETAAMKGLVRTINALVGDTLGTMKVEDTNGEWVDTNVPATYLGMPDVPAPNYPRIFLTYQGDTQEGFRYETGLVEIDDVENPGEKITVPYTSVYTNFVVSVTCESGDINKVQTGERMASGKILRRFRNLLNLTDNRHLLYTNMNATVNQIVPITNNDTFVETKFHSVSNMLMNFSTVDTYIYDSVTDGWFNVIEYEGTLAKGDEDPSPLVTTRTIGPSE